MSPFRLDEYDRVVRELVRREGGLDPAFLGSYVMLGDLRSSGSCVRFPVRPTWTGSFRPNGAWRGYSGTVPAGDTGSGGRGSHDGGAESRAVFRLERSAVWAESGPPPAG